MTTPAQILEWNDLTQGTATDADILQAFNLADDGGIIQAEDAITLFGYADPRRHTATKLRAALIALGCEPA